MIDGFSSYEYYDKLLDKSPVPIAYVGLDGTFEYLNKEWEELVGYSRDELKSLTFKDITHPQDIKSDINMHKQLIALEIDSYNMIKRYISKDGKTVWIHLYVQPIIEDGKVVRFVTTIIPLPNHGKFKVEKDKGELIVRPSITLVQFITDNFKTLAGWTIPILGGIIYFMLRFTEILREMMEKLNITW